MAIFCINNVLIKGVAACVPAAIESNLNYNWISEEERNLLIKTTGILNRRITTKDIITSDHCAAAARRLLAEANVEPSEISILVFVSQSRDYLLPSSATILQDRLGLPKSCIAFDVPLGCSGYVYGLSIVAGMMSSAGLKKGLLLAGDASSMSLDWKDKSTYPLFGDAGSATLLEYSDGGKMHFNLQSDGSNHEAIIIPHGGHRRLIDHESDIEEEHEKGVVRKKKNVWLNGFDIFNFSVREVPPNVKELLAATSSGIDSIDHFIMHQANLLLNETIRKKLKIESVKVPYSLKEYGNTSSASIPLTMVANLRNELTSGNNRLLLSGFGVGLSWGSVILNTKYLIIPEIVEL